MREIFLYLTFFFIAPLFILANLDNDFTACQSGFIIRIERIIKILLNKNEALD